MNYDLLSTTWSELWDMPAAAFWLPIAISFVVGIFGMIVGIIIELNHFWSLARREKKMRDVVTTASKTLPANAISMGLVIGTVALSEDTFRSVLIRIRKLFGGRIGRFEKLMRRARREAVLRMAAAAKSQGAMLVANVRFETSNIAASSNGSITAMEVMAYGTAIKVVER